MWTIGKHKATHPFVHTHLFIYNNLVELLFLIKRFTTSGIVFSLELCLLRQLFYLPLKICLVVKVYYHKKII